MELIIALFALAAGIWLWYIVFYFRYADRKLVDDLRNTVQELHHQIQTNQINLKEFEQQNLILKEKTTNLISENADFRKVTSELSRYYHRIKEWYAKSLELVDLLKGFDKDFDEKLRVSWWEDGPKSIPIHMTSLESGMKRF